MVEVYFCIEINAICACHEHVCALPRRRYTRGFNLRFAIVVYNTYDYNKCTVFDLFRYFASNHVILLRVMIMTILHKNVLPYFFFFYS